MRYHVPTIALCLLAAACSGGCSNSEEDTQKKQLQALRDKASPENKVVPVGAARKAELPEARAAAEKKPDDFATQYNLAVTAGQAGDLKTAFEAAEKALKLKPDSNAAKEMLAHYLTTC
jgi:hypothetical protein